MRNMNNTTVDFEKMKADRAQAREERTRQTWELARKVATGQKVDAPTLAGILTDEEAERAFEAAVYGWRRRLADGAKVDAGAKAAAGRPAIDAAIAAAKAKLDAAEAAYWATVEPLGFKLKEIERAESTASDAGRDLSQAVVRGEFPPLLHLAHRLKAVMSELRELEGQTRGLARVADDHRAVAANRRAEAGDTTLKVKYTESEQWKREAAEEAERSAERAAKALAEHNAAKAKLVEEMRDLERKMRQV